MADAVDKVKGRVRAREELDDLPPVVREDLERLDAEGEPAVVADLTELDETGPHVAAPSNADWWDSEFDWGASGSFGACVDVASGKVDDPEAFCAQRHYDATGEWPGAKKGG